MPISAMLEQSGILTVLGMCVVFSFLVIMIACMNLLRIIVKAFGWDKVATKVEAPVQAAPAVDEKAIVAAIATALHEKK